MAEFRKKRKKVCYMCLGKPVDYKDINVITKYYQEDLLEHVHVIKDM